MRIIFFGLLGLLLPVLASAQQPADTNKQRPATLPIEVAMIHAKLSNTAPDFEQMAMESPAVQNADSFGREALLAEGKSTLEKVFKTLKRDTLIIVREAVPISESSPSEKTISFNGLDADTPLMFKVGDTTYGIFIRNAKDMVLPMQEPYYESGDWISLQRLTMEQASPLVELTLKPVGADPESFTTYQDDVVKPVIADLIEIKVYSPTDPTRVLLVKRDPKAYPEKTVGELEELVQDDLTVPGEEPLAPKTP